MRERATKVIKHGLLPPVLNNCKTTTLCKEWVSFVKNKAVFAVQICGNASCVLDWQPKETAFINHNHHRRS
jgi:hypothetical protein